MSNSADTTVSPEAATSRGLDQLDARLAVVWSPDQNRLGSSVALSHDLLLIGRDAHEHGLPLADPQLSRVHARLTFDPRAGAHRIGDADSRNGTFVLGRRVDTALLTHGDVIRCGESLFVYQSHDSMQALREQVGTFATSSLNILLRGETGTGKELFARAIHGQSGRSGEFVAINCASVPTDLVAAELFGHTKSAFSGAGSARKGVFAAAHGGTLFLDEVGDCPPAMQAALLRALQERAVRPVGADREIAVDIRVIAATHANLEAAMSGGRFRPDLYARLAQLTLTLPALRERRADIIALAAEISAQLGRPLRLDADAAEALLCWSWPFNVRELQSLLMTVQASNGETIGLSQLRACRPELARPVLERSSGVAPRNPELNAGSSGERAQLRELLEQHLGNVSAVAKSLGEPRPKIYRRLRALGLSASRFRP